MSLPLVVSRCRVLLVSMALLPLSVVAVQASAQAPTTAPAAAAARQIGTVKAVSGTSLTLTTDAGTSVDVILSDTARVQQLAPGSTDLKTAQPATAADITTGDRVLVVTRTGDNGALSATRVVLMKSTAIAQNNATRQADWQRRGVGGIVNAVEPAGKTLAITSGAKKVTVQTNGQTIFRRYAPGSVKFEEAVPSTLAALQPGDQLRVRGDKSPDGSSITADEVVSGSFLNLAGTITSVNPAAKTIVLKDLASKKDVTIAVTDESDLRAMPPETAARFAARARGAAAGGPGTDISGAGAPGSRAGGADAAAASSGTDAVRSGPRSSPDGSSTTRPGSRAGAAGTVPTAGAGSERGSGGGGRSGAGGDRGTAVGDAAHSDAANGGAANGGAANGGAGGGDLSRVIERLPKASLADLKPGEALMIVASGQAGAGSVTAVTLLTGVEPLLAASPRGAAGFNASNWNLGGGAGEGGGGEAGAGPQ